MYFLLNAFYYNDNKYYLNHSKSPTHNTYNNFRSNTDNKNKKYNKDPVKLYK